MTYYCHSADDEGDSSVFLRVMESSTVRGLLCSDSDLTKDWTSRWGDRVEDSKGVKGA